MVKRTLTFIVASLVIAHVSAAVPAVRAMYGDALAKEQAVRKALADPHMSDVVLKAVREVVASYEAVVRHYPASSYSDDALWNAGRLELDAFARFGQQPDKDAAARLFSRLAACVSEQQTGEADSARHRPRGAHGDSNSDGSRANAIALSECRTERALYPGDKQPAGADRDHQGCPSRGDGETRCASRSSSIRKCRSTTSGSAIPIGSSSTCRRRVRRGRCWIERCASTATPTSCVRCASGAIRTTRREWFWMRAAFRATACIRCMTRIVS